MPDAAQAVLEREIEPVAKIIWFNIPRSASRYFTGSNSGYSFRLRSQFSYGNAFQPLINVDIVPNISGSRINIKMRLPIILIIFLCLWMSIMGYTCIGFLVKQAGEVTDANFFGPLGMALFVYFIAMSGFKFASFRVKNKLSQLFPGDIEKA